MCTPQAINPLVVPTTGEVCPSYAAWLAQVLNEPLRHACLFAPPPKQTFVTSQWSVAALLVPAPTDALQHSKLNVVAGRFGPAPTWAALDQQLLFVNCSGCRWWITLCVFYFVQRVKPTPPPTNEHTHAHTHTCGPKSACEQTLASRSELGHVFCLLPQFKIPPVSLKEAELFHTAAHCCSHNHFRSTCTRRWRGASSPLMNEYIHWLFCQKNTVWRWTYNALFFSFNWSSDPLLALTTFSNI